MLTWQSHLFPPWQSKISFRLSQAFKAIKNWLLLSVCVFISHLTFYTDCTSKHNKIKDKPFVWADSFLWSIRNISIDIRDYNSRNAKDITWGENWLSYILRETREGRWYNSTNHHSVCFPQCTLNKIYTIFTKDTESSFPGTPKPFPPSHKILTPKSALPARHSSFTF